MELPTPIGEDRVGPVLVLLPEHVVQNVLGDHRVQRNVGEAPGPHIPRTPRGGVPPRPAGAGVLACGKLPAPFPGKARTSRPGAGPSQCRAGSGRRGCGGKRVPCPLPGAARRSSPFVTGSLRQAFCAKVEDALDRFDGNFREQPVCLLTAPPALGFGKLRGLGATERVQGMRTPTLKPRVAPAAATGGTSQTSASRFRAILSSAARAAALTPPK